ncbi:MAG TPA: hypothetical protein DIW47_09805 [Bacteroidetes bacterium]|nr:hypothetical protein [Bacteroidota bacterium]
MRYILSLLFLSVISIGPCFSYGGFHINAVSFYYGDTYRFDAKHRHTFSLDLWKLGGGCIQSSYSGYGANLEWINRSEYTIGARYYKSFQRHPAADGVMVYFGVAPSVLTRQNLVGFRLAPEVGLHFTTLYEYVGISVNLLYGYDIPLSKEGRDPSGGNRITLKIGLDFNRPMIKKLFSKKEKKNSAF